MRNKRSFIILSVLGLLVALTTTVYATASAHPASPTIVGTWQITIPKSEGNPEAFESFHTFFADGNWVEFNSFGETGHGVWMGADNTYLLTFGNFAFDEKGKHSGGQTVHSSIRMDGTDHLTAQWVVDTIDSAGKVTKKAYYGTFEGTRMEVALP